MNSFGTTTLFLPLYDPRSVRENRSRFRRDAIPLLERANSLYVPCGRWPARGWLLLARSDYNKLNTYSTSLQLTIGDPRKPDNVQIQKNLAIVQAQCVTRGLASDSSALYLVEVCDARGVLCNRWFQFPLNAQYNIRSPAYPQVFQASSTNSGAAWSWSTMLQNIWQTMPLLGTWPGLPSTPTGVPEGFWFVGKPALYALCDVLDCLGMTIACDLTKSSPFTIVSEGAADTAFTALQTKYATPTSTFFRLEDDQEWIDTGSGRVPSIVKVFFRRRNSVYGTEETVYYGNDGVAQQWDTKAAYVVSVAAPTQFTNAAGTHHLWSDFTVRYDQDSQPLAADTATAAAIAAERVTQYFGKIYSLTDGFMSQDYAGALPFTTGAQVDGVCYYQDYRGNDYGGWRTKIVRGDSSPPFPGIWDDYGY